MKLISIRLHPFGKFNDVVHTFTSGIHVVEGPNEFGKSTMSNAIRHALYTPTALTPAKLQKAIGEWFPHPYGVQCAVTLVIEADGITYTITKTWSKQGSTSLTGSNGEHLIGSAAEARINGIVGFNQATWDYVFHTSQAALADTVEALSQHSASMDDLVAASTTAANDISPERLLALIDARIKKQYDNWDRDLARPRDGRGIDYQWKQNIGTILAAYYDWQLSLSQLGELERYNVRVDDLRRELSALHDRDTQLDADVRHGQSLRTSLQNANALHVTVERLSELVPKQQQAYDEWPIVIRDIVECTRRTEELTAALDLLHTESAHATAQQSAASLRSTYAQILDAHHGVERAEEALHAYTPVTQETIDTLTKLVQTIDRLNVKIAAHALAATITSDRDAVLDIAIGSNVAEPITVSATTSWSYADVPGILSITHDGITITVKSATDDVAELLDALRTVEAERDAAIAATGLPTIDAIREARATYVALEQQRNEQLRLYRQVLGDKTIDAWTAEHDALANLPPSRPLAEVNHEFNRVQGDLIETRSKLSALEKQRDDYAALYGTREDLLDLFTENRSKRKVAEAALSQLPAIPDGYATADDYLLALEQMERELSNVRLRRTAIDSELLHLQAPKVDSSFSDLTDLVQLRREAFDRAVSDGEALYRIRAAAERAAAQQQTAGPMQQLPALISDLFDKLTSGKYNRIDVEGTTPQRASGYELQQLPVERLSRGTRTSLALATRIALAEAYLQDRHGVIMLDDPFVDMDTDRRRAAMDVLREVSANHQVIMFTCHPQS